MSTHSQDIERGQSVLTKVLYHIVNHLRRDTYFKVLELVKWEIERRFNQADFHLIQQLESLLLDVANGKPSLPDESLMNR